MKIASPSNPNPTHHLEGRGAFVRVIEVTADDFVIFEYTSPVPSTLSGELSLSRDAFEFWFAELSS